MYWKERKDKILEWNRPRSYNYITITIFELLVAIQEILFAC